MSVLGQIDEKVSQLLISAGFIMSIKDSLFDLLGTVGDHGGQFTFVETKIAYTRARDINEQYRAWYTEAWYLVKSNLPERLEEFETAYAGAAFQLGDMMNEHAILHRSTLALFEKCFSPRLAL
jgi:hypothetical protein